MSRWYLGHLGCLVFLLASYPQLGSTEESVYLQRRQSYSILQSKEWVIEENNSKLLVVFKLKSASSIGDILTTMLLKDGQPYIKLIATVDDSLLNVSLFESEVLVASIEGIINLGEVNQFSIEVDNANQLLTCKYNQIEKIENITQSLNWANTIVEVLIGSQEHHSITGCVSLIALQINDVVNSQISTKKKHLVFECDEDQSCENRNCGQGKCVQKHIGVCDCYGTGKSGLSCENDATTIELNNEGLEENISYRGIGQELRRLAMQFKLKGSTDGVLAYVSLRNGAEIQIFVVGNLGTVKISPNTTLEFDLNPEKMFHKLQLIVDNIENRHFLKLNVDGVQKEFPLASEWLIGTISFGSGPAEEGVSDAGFTGCFKELYVNGDDVVGMAYRNEDNVVLANPPRECSNHGSTSDSIFVNGVTLIPPEDAPSNDVVLITSDADEDEIVSTAGKTEETFYLRMLDFTFIGKRPVIIQCENMMKTACENEADCLVINGKVTCICEPGYAGTYCQFVLLPRTCAEAKTFFHQRDGPTILDVDGSYSLRRSVASCKDGHTIVPNNMPPNTLIRSVEQQNWIFRLSYLDFLYLPQLSTLIAQSGKCEQTVVYDCNRAPLNFDTSQTYFHVVTNNQTVTQIGRENGTCECRDYHNCLRSESCNCDALGSAEDKGVLTGTQAGITEIISLSVSGSVAGRMTVGPLNCSGFAGENESFQFTSKKELAFTDIRDVQQISLQFRTSVHSGIILTIGQTVLELLDAYTIRISQDDRTVVLGSQTKLNNSIWHLLRLQWMDGDFLVSVDSHFTVSDKIKMLPDHLVINSLERGFYGCVRSVIVNNELMNLKEVAVKQSLDYKECSNLCAHISCQNEAECFEDYQTDEATCRCVYPDIQSGATCEIDINHHSSISLHGGYMAYENITNPLTENTVFSFRTDQSNALLFYAHDHLRNFIQVHLRDEVNLTLTLNRDHEIYTCTVSALNGDEFSHMQWIQIAIKHIQNEYTQLLVKDEACFIRAPLLLSPTIITQYKNWNINDGVEIPVGLDSSVVTDPTLKIFVGGVTDVESEDEVIHKLRPSYRTKLPNLLGCMRGLKIGDQVIDLRNKTFGVSPEDPSLVRMGCEVGCETLTCYNGGHCSIGWKNYDPSASKTNCDCSRTSYAGQSCTEDYGVHLSNQLVDFNITSLMARFVDPPLRMQSLKFAFSPAAASVHTRQVISVLSVEDRLFEVILNRNSSLNVAIHDTKQVQVLTFNGNFTDGYRHFFVARFGPNIPTSVMIDSSRQSFSHDKSSFLDLRQASQLLIGGRGEYLADYGSAGLKKNYEGCMSNLELNVGEGTKPLEFHLIDRIEEAKSTSPVVRGHCSSFRIPNQPPVMQNTISLPIFHSAFSRAIFTGVIKPDQPFFTMWQIILGVLLLIAFVLFLICLIKCGRRCIGCCCKGPEIIPTTDLHMSHVRQPESPKFRSKFDVPEPEGSYLLGQRSSRRSGRNDWAWVQEDSYQTGTPVDEAHEIFATKPNYLNRFWHEAAENTSPVPVSTPSCPTDQEAK